LKDLDPESAFYDPKSRSMREESKEVVDPANGFIKYSEDSKQFFEMQRFTWEAIENGGQINPSAAPSQAEYLFEEYMKKKNTRRN